eukprot:5361665-Prorocentrum_lima.AAC.1
MRQSISLLEPQQIQAMDAPQRLIHECQVYQSCGMQQALENMLPEEPHLLSRALIESISGDVREQQRSQEHNPR